ncbi:MAG: T9SS type A sorting domain-containing protein [Jejuia sp.]
MKENKSGNLTSVDVSELGAGIYYLEITTKDLSEIHKIIVEK